MSCSRVICFLHAGTTVSSDKDTVSARVWSLCIKNKKYIVIVILCQNGVWVRMI